MNYRYEPGSERREPRDRWSRDVESYQFDERPDDRWRRERGGRYTSEDMYGGRGDERNFPYEHERGGREGYRGMSGRLTEQDEFGGPQRYSSYPWSSDVRQSYGSESRYGGQYRGGRGDYDYYGPYGSEFRGRSEPQGSDAQRSDYGSSRYGTSFVAPQRGNFAGRGPKGYRRSDERIQEEVCERLTQNPDIDASELEIKVQDGNVTLTGSVDERHHKRMAEDIAENVSGVKDVRNEIRVSMGKASGEKMSAASSTGWIGPEASQRRAS